MALRIDRSQLQSHLKTAYEKAAPKLQFALPKPGQRIDPRELRELAEAWKDFLTDRLGKIDEQLSTIDLKTVQRQLRAAREKYPSMPFNQSQALWDSIVSLSQQETAVSLLLAERAELTLLQNWIETTPINIAPSGYSIASGARTPIYCFLTSGNTLFYSPK